jgi:hypothetical protein
MLVVVAVAVLIGLFGAFMWWYRPTNTDTRSLGSFVAEHAIAAVVAAVLVGALGLFVAWLSA